MLPDTVRLEANTGLGHMQVNVEVTVLRCVGKSLDTGSLGMVGVRGRENRQEEELPGIYDLLVERFWATGATTKSSLETASVHVVGSSKTAWESPFVPKDRPPSTQRVQPW